MQSGYLVSSQAYKVLFLAVAIFCVNLAPCQSEEMDGWPGSWAIQHQVLGVPRLARLEVQRTDDHLDATLSSDTGVVKTSDVVADAEKLAVTYPMDIAGSMGQVKLKIQRDQTTDSFLGFLSVDLRQSKSQFAVKATRFSSEKEFADRQNALNSSLPADENFSRVQAANGQEFLGRWQLKLKSGSDPQQEVEKRAKMTQSVPPNR